MDQDLEWPNTTLTSPNTPSTAPPEPKAVYAALPTNCVTFLTTGTALFITKSLTFPKVLLSYVPDAIISNLITTLKLMYFTGTINDVFERVNQERR